MSTYILTALMLFTCACLIPTASIILGGKIKDADTVMAISMLSFPPITISVGIILLTFNF